MNPLYKLEKAWKEVTDLFDKTYFTYEDGDIAHGDWIGEEFGGSYEINGYFFSGDDIVTALRHKTPKGTLFAWYDEYYKVQAEREQCKKCGELGKPKRIVPNLNHYTWMVQSTLTKRKTV